MSYKHMWAQLCDYVEEARDRNDTRSRATGNFHSMQDYAAFEAYDNILEIMKQFEEQEHINKYERDM